MPVVASAPTPAGVEVVWLGHGHFDQIVDAPALAQIYNVPLRVPGDLANTAMTLGVLPANLLLRMDKGGTVEPLPGVKPIVAWAWTVNARLR